LRSEEVVENHEEEGKEEQIEVTRDLHQEKGKEVSIELLQHQFLFLNYQEAMRVVY
jgi:predicted HAD superfamily phosphohydrolase